MEQIVHAFITSIVVTRNALLHRLRHKQIQQLQRVQNGAARLVNDATKFCLATPLLIDLHWQPIAAEFKILRVHRALTGGAADYINYKTEQDLAASIDMKVSEQGVIAASKDTKILGLIRRNIIYKENS